MGLRRKEDRTWTLPCCVQVGRKATTEKSSIVGVLSGAISKNEYLRGALRNTAYHPTSHLAGYGLSDLKVWDSSPGPPSHPALAPRLMTALASVFLLTKSLQSDMGKIIQRRETDFRGDPVS